MRQFLFILSILFSVHAQAQESVMDFYKNPINVPPLQMQDMQGNVVSLEQFKGKVVLLNLWATWCKPCQMEMPAFNFLQKRYKDGGFEVVAVALQDTLERIQEFIENNRLTEINPFLDSTELVGRAFQPKSMPTTYLINRKGQIIAGKEGLSDWLSQDMMTLVESELKKNQPQFKLPEGMEVIDRNDVHGGIRF
ncbi:MAG: hypothetical protein CMF61_06435 [Magnetococcales bacterium]|nr:hypothetical protein [Magnetococcales bacterium]PPR16424.1 MAG: Thiol:disulfide interchange protein TlpA [Pseudomonadota bacterium]